MKKLAKTLFMSLIAAAASSAIAADANSKLIKFSTAGDTYADGTAVLDGERYALCWSPNETFSGINVATWKGLADGDEVIRVVSCAKDGKCPLTIFVLDGDEVKTTGNYFVALLDTRVSATQLSATVDGKPATVNGAAEAVATGTYGVAKAETSAPTVDQFGVAVPASLEIVTTGENAIVKVVNINPLVTYSIKYGKTLSLEGGTATFQVENAFDKESSISFNFDEANFFRLVEPTK